jgi:hypothetical protein
VTRVHTLSFAADDFANLDTKGASSDEQFVSRGEPKAGSWKAYDVEWEHETGRPQPDFEMIVDVPVFTRAAYETLSGVLEGRGETLPLGTADVVAFNVTRVVDALDEDRSEIKRFSSGRVMRIAHPVFDPAKVAGETIFRVTTYPRTVFVTDAFVDAADGLKGMALSEDWMGGAEAAPEPEGERVWTPLVPDAGPPDELVAHHLIPPLDIPSETLQQAQAHAQKLGIDPDEAANGVALPRARHETAYTDTYFDTLWQRFRQADDRDSGVAVLQRIGEELAAGDFP